LDVEQADLSGPLWWDVEGENLWLRVTLADLDTGDEVAVLWLDETDQPLFGWRCDGAACSVSEVPTDTPLQTSTWIPGGGVVVPEALDDVGLDLALGVSRERLLDDHGVTDDTIFRLAVFTLHDAEVSDRFDCDADCDLSTLALDPMDIDRDHDGLSSARETLVGANPDDVDTDGDGLADGAEPQTDDDLDGVYAALDCDSDGDGLGDGLESGVVEPLGPEKEGSTCFVPDLDPSTMTDPWAADSDGGGLDDGAEDWNGNGRLDAPWETSPLDPLDDADTDADGIPDAVELAAPDQEVNDEDSDADGISDRVEGVVDTDDDGWPDFADTDSDADGLLDADEGDGDTDGDGLPHFRDVDSDEDTWLDSVEGLVDTDFDGLPDRLDLDSDNDGIPDAEESGDVDCDGLDDRIDGDHESDFCDTGQAIPGTADEPWAGPIRPAGPDLSEAWFGGGGCATVTNGGPLFWWVLPVLLFRRMGWFGCLALGSVANAQEVNVDRFRPAPGSSWLVTEDPWISGHQHGVSTTTDLATDVVTLRTGERVVETILPQVVSTRLSAHSMPVRGVGLGVVLPWHVTSLGTEVGDVELSARATRLVGTSLRTGLAVSGQLGTGNAPWLSSVCSTIQGEVLFGWEFCTLRVAVASGCCSGTGERVGRLSIGPSWIWVIAMDFRAEPRWRIGVEAF
jgi:hypothetical protein